MYSIGSLEKLLVVVGLVMDSSVGTRSHAMTLNPRDANILPHIFQ
jgi:hypothetical protein